MDTRHIVRIAAVVMATALLLTLVFAATAFAAQSSTAATAVGAAAAPAAAEAAPAESAAAGAKHEIPHTGGHPSAAQIADIRRAWDGIPGFDLLLVAIIGVVATFGIVGFGAYKQMKV